MNETCSLSQTEGRDFLQVITYRRKFHYFLIAIEQAPLSTGSESWELLFLVERDKPESSFILQGWKGDLPFVDNRLKKTAAGGVLFTRDKRVSCFSPSNGRKSSHESFSRDRGSGTFPLGGRKFVAFLLSLSGILFSTIVNVKNARLSHLPQI